jgi:hypothetical protein
MLHELSRSDQLIAGVGTRDEQKAYQTELSEKEMEGVMRG